MILKYLPIISTIVFVVIVTVGVLIFKNYVIPKSSGLKIQQLKIQITGQSTGTAKELKKYTLEEVEAHNNINDCWLVINNNVYDITEFIPQHPGGKRILSGCGKDATDYFQGQDIHREENAAQYLPEFLIGSL